MKKICRKCEEEKEPELFYFSDLYPDGREPTCKKCRQAMDKLRRKYVKINKMTQQEEEFDETQENRLLRCWRPVRDDSL